MGMSSMM